MRRRDFIKVVGSAAAWPLIAVAQQPDRMRRIGVLMGFAESDREGQAFVAAFREAEAWVGGGSQHSDRLSLDGAGQAVDPTIREGTRCTEARPHSYAKHARHCGAAATNTYHSHRGSRRRPPRIARMERQTVIVTGATGGIGKACVKRCVDDGYNVVALGRTMERLKEVVPGPMPLRCLPATFPKRRIVQPGSILR